MADASICRLPFLACAKRRSRPPFYFLLPRACSKRKNRKEKGKEGCILPPLSRPHPNDPHFHFGWMKRGKGGNPPPTPLIKSKPSLSLHCRLCADPLLPCQAASDSSGRCVEPHTDGWATSFCGNRALNFSPFLRDPILIWQSFKSRGAPILIFPRTRFRIPPPLLLPLREAVPGNPW
ncbi:hypothetical protein IE53DRAFT_144315 [Violaceomyces palustris]|uniref:Uncharacterized protein n=1 Tax=Violaceomyces palustris TaxID=1673888 RepID=A0ACD0NUG8_9BASI|nr:hypothetical protein IE53DRAFT_144315 [Violaceomyces palustris]